MAQMHTLDDLLLTRQAPPAVNWSHIFDTAADEPDLADDDDEEEDDEDEDEDDEDEDDEDEDDEDDEEDDDSEDEDEDLEDDEEIDEDDEGAGARTARGQLKRQNGHRWGGHTNG